MNGNALCETVRSAQDPGADIALLRGALAIDSVTGKNEIIAMITGVHTQ